MKIPLPHQLAAIAELEQDIRVNGYDVAMRRNRPWFSVWSQAGKQSNPLPVPYQSQRDNYRDASRTLTDEEVEAAHSSIRAALGKQLGALLRS